MKVSNIIQECPNKNEEDQAPIAPENIRCTKLKDEEIIVRGIQLKVGTTNQNKPQPRIDTRHWMKKQRNHTKTVKDQWTWNKRI